MPEKCHYCQNDAYYQYVIYPYSLIYNKNSPPQTEKFVKINKLICKAHNDHTYQWDEPWDGESDVR